MDKKSIPKKVPIIISIVWLLVSIAFQWYALPMMFDMRGWAANPATQAFVFQAGLIFSVVTMIVIHILSKKAQVKWLAIISMILLFLYSVFGIVDLLAAGLVDMFHLASV